MIKRFFERYWPLMVGLLVLAVGIIGSRCDKAEQVKVEQVKVERDTVVVYDTIFHHYPKPVDSAVVRYVTKVLPVVRRDTIHQLIEANNLIHDTVAVEVPITSKHYGAPEYDAWVSGYEPSLDSIKVYQRTEYITERITISKPPDKWELDIVGGIDYNTAQEKYTPYAVGELLYKPSRLQLGIQGGVIRADKIEPIVGVKAKIMVF